MLDEQFSGYLDAVFPTEYAEMINSAREAILLYEFSLVEANLYKAMPEDSDITVFESKQVLERCIRDGFKEILLAIGVRTTIVHIPDLDLLLRAFKNLEETSQHEQVVEIISSDELCQFEILEKLIELVTVNPNVGDLLFEIELIETNAFFNRLYDLHLAAYRSQSGEATEERPNKSYYERIKKFTMTYPDALVSRKLTSKDILFGETFEHYIKENEEELKLLYPNHPDRCPKEFAGLAVFANLPRHMLSTEIKKAISRFYNDLRFTTKTNYLVDKFIEELEYEDQPASMVQTGY